MFEDLQDDTTNLDDALLELRIKLIKSWTNFTDIYNSYMNMNKTSFSYEKLTNIVNNRINNKDNTDFFIFVGVIFNSEIMHTMINLKLNNPHFTIYAGGTEMFYIKNKYGVIISMQKYIKNYLNKLDVANHNFNKLRNDK